MTQAVPKERILEHVVVVRILRVCVSFPETNCGGRRIIPRETVQQRAGEQVPEWPVPQITVETVGVAKKIVQDRVQKRVDELTEDVAMPQIPKETDEATWLIPLKRFCAQIFDVPVARIQERLAEVS